MRRIYLPSCVTIGEGREIYRGFGGDMRASRGIQPSSMKDRNVVKSFHPISGNIALNGGLGRGRVIHWTNLKIMQLFW